MQYFLSITDGNAITLRFKISVLFYPQFYNSCGHDYLQECCNIICITCVIG